MGIKWTIIGQKGFKAVTFPSQNRREHLHWLENALILTTSQQVDYKMDINRTEKERAA